MDPAGQKRPMTPSGRRIDSAATSMNEAPVVVATHLATWL
jgi:hypothetical protein